MEGSLHALSKLHLKSNSYYYHCPTPLPLIYS